MSSRFFSPLRLLLLTCIIGYVFIVFTSLRFTWEENDFLSIPTLFQFTGSFASGEEDTNTLNKTFPPSPQASSTSGKSSNLHPSTDQTAQGYSTAAAKSRNVSESAPFKPLTENSTINEAKPPLKEVKTSNNMLNTVPNEINNSDVKRVAQLAESGKQPGEKDEPKTNVVVPSIEKEKSVDLRKESVIPPNETKPANSTTTQSKSTEQTQAKTKLQNLDLEPESSKSEGKYTVDSLCAGCRHASVSNSFCGTKMKKMMDNQSLSLVEAANQTARDQPGSCGRCNPDVCQGVGKYWRFDHAAPTIRRAKTHYLPSVPSQYRLSPNAMDNFDEYLADPENVYPKKLHLFEYNPSIVLLPKKYQVPVEGSGKIPVYLASYRLSHFNMCFETDLKVKIYGGSWSSFKSIGRTDYLGFALLDENLNILLDTVVTLKNKKNKTVKQLRFFRSPDLMDYRIFRLHDDIYLSQGITLAPIYLSTNNATVESAGPDSLYRLKQVFPGKFDVWIRQYASCAIYGYKVFETSKNLQYFVDGNNATMMNYSPGKNPHDVRNIDVLEKCGKQNITIYNKTEYQDTPTPSFGNMEELQYPFLNKGQNLFTMDRGSACCAKIRSSIDGEEYFFGVSHPKTVYPGKQLPDGVIPNTYLSRFFAFEQHPPYRIVARTGKFCFGYSEEKDSGHPLWNLNGSDAINSPLYFGSETLNCPRVHFVSGITSKAGDDSKVIIAYGVSDCLSRFIELDKSEIAKKLWNP